MHVWAWGYLFVQIIIYILNLFNIKYKNVKLLLCYKKQNEKTKKISSII